MEYNEDVDISVRFGVPESTPIQWELLMAGAFHVSQTKGKKFLFTKDVIQWKLIKFDDPEVPTWLNTGIPVGARLVILDENEQVIAWIRIKDNETPLRGNIRKI